MISFIFKLRIYIFLCLYNTSGKIFLLLYFIYCMNKKNILISNSIYFIPFIFGTKNTLQKKTKQKKKHTYISKYIT